MRKNIIILLINIAYFLLIVIFSKSDYTFLTTQNVMITLSLIGCLYSLYGGIDSIKIKNNFKWLFLSINVLFFLIYSYGLYFDIVAYNK
ncbi:hypothetical protein NK356_19500 [Chryseobacterium sp. S0630]|uniref:hypothetical protein n=1 Tax=Chryseobacterium sp. S0630 TaxID=2957803 RepID=UPI00209E2DFD|nr:hypothetical protein [Chryseobacterium sp. S0630]MCP1301368.1 hypothetical protein [Chryseobacterium sp. S0630]